MMVGPRPSHVRMRHVVRLAPTSATVQLDPRRPAAGSAATSAASPAAQLADGLEALAEHGIAEPRRTR